MKGYREIKNSMEGLSASNKRHVLVEAAKRGIQDQGYTMERVPGRGLSSVWNITKDGKMQVASIRTTQDRWFAFPPLKNGTAWKTLDNVQIVIVAAVDDCEDPENAEVYVFPADEVRKRFDAAYAARIGAGQSVKDNFGMWVRLDHDDRGIAASVGSGIIDLHKSVASYAIKGLLTDETGRSEDDLVLMDEAIQSSSSTTMAEIMASARERIADIAGVELESVKLELKVEY